MDLQIQPNRWSCLLTSFAMAMDILQEELLEYIGHDGSEIIWPNLEEPDCRQGFHPQELVVAAEECGYLAIMFERRPTLARVGEPLILRAPELDLNTFIIGKVGVLISERHAVAWDGRQVFDPAARRTHEHRNLDIYHVFFWIVPVNHSVHA